MLEHSKRALHSVHAPLQVAMHPCSWPPWHTAFHISPHALPRQGWATLFLANCALAFNVLTIAYNRPAVLTVLLLLLMGFLFLLAGMWLTLQFRWIQVRGT